jgi:hypothetical protein
VTRERSDPRDRRADAIQKLIATAREKPGQRLKISEFLFPTGSNPDGPAGWPAPSPDERPIAQEIIITAAASAHRALRQLGQGTLHARSASHPRDFTIRPDPGPIIIGHPAPLVVALLEDQATFALDAVLTYAHSPRAGTADGEPDLLRQPDIHLHQMHRLNGFLKLEANLWFFAQMEITMPVPYLVRYAAAQWLWTPEIAGTAFCLRCGSEIEYQRAARNPELRQPRCRPCSRGHTPNWPRHAIAPADKGRWWLRCQSQGCTRPFVARKQARRCPTCTTSALTASKRKPLSRENF